MKLPDSPGKIDFPIVIVINSDCETVENRCEQFRIDDRDRKRCPAAFGLRHSVVPNLIGKRRGKTSSPVFPRFSFCSSLHVTLNQGCKLGSPVIPGLFDSMTFLNQHDRASSYLLAT